MVSQCLQGLIRSVVDRGLTLLEALCLVASLICNSLSGLLVVDLCFRVNSLWKARVSPVMSVCSRYWYRLDRGDLHIDLVAYAVDDFVAPGYIAVVDVVADVGALVAELPSVDSWRPRWIRPCGCSHLGLPLHPALRTLWLLAQPG